MRPNFQKTNQPINSMGQQHRRKVKRIRRKAYLTRKKERDEKATKSKK
jgi:hypothetical protein|tara:strand:+ start:581 stop:724 length:144 start_codon:yes stop_codon:yes gene_type:complete